MVTKLLESGLHPRRSFAAAVPSIALHSLLVMGAIHATAHAALRRNDGPRVVVLPLVAPHVDKRHPLRSPRLPEHGRTVTDRTRYSPVLPELPTVSIATPDFVPDHGEKPVVAGREFGNGITTDTGNGSSGPVTGGVHSTRQVDRQAEALAGTLIPAYPEALRTTGAEGTVVAQFVVDSAGRVEAGTFRVLSSTNDLFSAAVEHALRSARFRPAELEGVPVRQLVQQPFTFVLK